MLKRLPIRVRLTGAFALAMVVVLAGVALFVHARVESHLDESIDTALRTRAGDVAGQLERTGPRAAAPEGAGLADPEEALAQVLTPSGALVAGAGEPALSAAEARAAARAPLVRERDLAPVDGPARVLAVPAQDGERRPYVVVAAQSLDDRDETLEALLAAFAIGGLVAVLVASGVGFLLARAGFAPVEAMRRRAASVSLDRGGERLPLPVAQDEIHRLGQTLNQMLARLEASFESERRFVADASHELRTPLAVVKAELEGALRLPADDPQHRQALVAALDETDHLVQLSEDLLLVARAGDGKLPVRPEVLDVHELLDRARERFEDRAREQGREIVVDVAADLRAELDPLRVRQAIGNLVDNALRYGAGTVTLRASTAAAALVIQVSDQGAGFPPDLAARAFERFTRGDAARSRDGTGLGLAIVRAVVEAHGGSTSVDGATVSLSFPPSSHVHLSGVRDAAVKSRNGG
jgi:signal transduction histidine kinase